MPIGPGTELLHYRVVDKLGEGGMGVVWRARDTSLDRDVAIKVLPAALAGDPERLARFEREARTLASLNHPNIAAVYGLHESRVDASAVRFIAMELVEGEDLAERLARGALPAAEAYRLADQIAAALEAAHEQSVIHRDLKPANVRIAPGGRVKVLDFGLAKALDPTRAASGEGSVTRSPTLTSAGTLAGTLMGTAGYMSPEQARGKPVDRRADVWAFGCVLYEMLVGSGAFTGETVTDVLAAVVRSEPDWDALPGTVGADVRRLLARCLNKDLDGRLRSLGDARLDLADALDPAAATASGPARRARARTWPWALVAVYVVASVLAVAALAWRDGSGSGPASAGVHLSVVLPPELVSLPGDVGGERFAVSPDGRLIAFTARDQDTVRLYVRAIDSDRVTTIPESRSAASPFFSPDGRWIGFFSAGKLKKVAVSGGTPVVLADAPTSRGGVWLTDDTIVYAPAFDSGLMRIPAAGGESVALTVPDRDANVRTHRWPARVPGDRAVLFTIGTMDKPGDYTDAVLAAVELDTGRIVNLVEGGNTVRCVGRSLVYARKGTLLALAFDPESLTVSGAPVPVLEGVSGSPTSGTSDYRFTDDGTLVYMPAVGEDTDPELVRVDRQGGSEILPFQGLGVYTPRLSPDGRRLAVTLGLGLGEGDLWVYDLDERRGTRLTFDQSSAQPIWMPDGRRLLYACTRGGSEGAYIRPVDGSAEPEKVLSWVGSSVLFPDDLFPGGRTLLFTNHGGEGGSDLYTYTIGDDDPRPLLAGPAAESAGTISPDGSWFAYVSDESGRYEIYVRPYPGPGGKFQISTDGGKGPIWSERGDEIFYTDGDRMISVPVRTRPTFGAGEPRELFRVDLRRDLGPYADYQVAPDGETFYLFRRAPGTVEPRRIDLRFGFDRVIEDALRS